MCILESDFYAQHYCPDCDPCCREHYLERCIDGFNRLDKSPFRNTRTVRKPACDASQCRPYFSYA